MLVLGITTSTPQIGVALADGDGVRASWSAIRARRHAELVTPAIAQVCDAAGVGRADIQVVAVDTGPGLFTGLRVGVATAKAYAFALGVPVIPASSLDLLAFGVRHARRQVTAAVDARRSELFVASYAPVPGGMQQVSEPHTATPSELEAELAAQGDGHLLVGDGAHRYAARFTGNSRVQLGDPGVAYPSAASLVLLAHAQAMREEWVAADGVACTYLREPDAAINWQTRDGQVHR